MAHYERDKDDHRVFDGGEDEDDGEGSQLPVVIIAAILVLAAFGGVVWLAYNQGVARGRGDATPRITMTEGSKAGGDNSLKVYQERAGGEDDDSAAKTTASPAVAAPSQQAVAAPSQQVAAAAPTPVPPAPQTAKAAEPLKMAEPPKQAAPNTVDTPPPAAKPPALATKLPTPAAKLPAKPITTAQSTSVAMNADQPVVATKPPAQLGRPVPPPAHEAATPAPKPVAATPATKPVAAPPASKPVKAASGSFLLQIGAYKSEDEAAAAWKTYQAKHATLLSGFAPDIQQATVGDKVWYRLRIASFADKDTASALCDRLKAQNGNCFLAH